MEDQAPKTGLFQVVEVDETKSAAKLVDEAGFKVFDPVLFQLFPLEPTGGTKIVPVKFDVLGQEVNSVHALPLLKHRFKGRPPRFRVALEFAARFRGFTRQEPLVALVTRPDGTLGGYVVEFSFFGQTRIARPVPVSILWSATRRYLFEM